MQLHQPCSLFVADRSLGLYGFDSTGTQFLFIPLAAADPDLSDINGVAADGNGNLYTIDTDIDTLVRFSLEECRAPAPEIVVTFTG